MKILLGLMFRLYEFSLFILISTYKHTHRNTNASTIRNFLAYNYVFHFIFRNSYRKLDCN